MPSGYPEIKKGAAVWGKGAAVWGGQYAAVADMGKGGCINA